MVVEVYTVGSDLKGSGVEYPEVTRCSSYLHRPELVEQLQEAREEKKRIRKNLREFEDQFFRQNGR